MKVELTTEWILTNLPVTRSVPQPDPKSKGQTPYVITEGHVDYHLVKLALDTLGVEYTAEDYGEEIDGHIIFNIKGVTNEMFWTERIKG